MVKQLDGYSLAPTWENNSTSQAHTSLAVAIPHPLPDQTCSAGRRGTTMAPPQPAHLVDELVEEVLLRISVSESANLVRATLVCKLWCRLITGHTSHRTFRAPPRSASFTGARAAPASCRSPSSRPDAICDSWRVLHGRVLTLDVLPCGWCQCRGSATRPGARWCSARRRAAATSDAADAPSSS